MKNYVEGLDLSFDPFEPLTSKNHFYGGGNRQELCNQIVESAMYGENIIAVYGCLGSGKSTLATEVAKSFADEAVSVLVLATLFMNSDQFIESLADQLNLPSIDFGKDKVIEEISELAHQLDLEAKSLLIQIDNAHELSRDVLHDLLKIKSICPPNSVHIVLLGETQLANMLQSILTTQQGAGLIEFELTGFASDATIDYVRFKLERAGFSKPLPMSGADLGSIHNSSNGIPGVINILASEILERRFQMSDTHSSEDDFDLDAGPANRRSAAEEGPESGRSPAFVYMVAASVLVVVFLAAIVFIQPDTQPDNSATPISVATTAAPQPTPLNQARVVPPAPVPEPVSVAGAVSSSSLSAPAQSSALSGQVDRQPALEASNAPKAEPLLAAAKSEAATASNVASAAKVATAKPSEPVKAAIPAPAKTQASKPVLAGLSSFEQKLMSSPSSNYVVQVLGASSKSNIQSFIDKEKIGADTGYFETRLNGKPWYVVLVGNFPDRASATAAMNRLPAAAKAYGPWVRGVAEIQSAINSLQRSN
jgi:DamX protein